MVPSTPTLFIPKRSDGFGEMIRYGRHVGVSVVEVISRAREGINSLKYCILKDLNVLQKLLKSITCGICHQTFFFSPIFPILAHLMFNILRFYLVLRPRRA